MDNGHNKSISKIGSKDNKTDGDIYYQAPPIPFNPPNFEEIKNPYKDIPCQEGHDYRWSDLCAQWKAADAARTAAMWTIGGVVSGFAIGVLGLVGVGVTVNYSKKALRTAQKDLENTIKSQRPFLMAADPELRRLDSSIPDQFGVFFNIANHGSEIGIIQEIIVEVQIINRKNVKINGRREFKKSISINMVNAVSTGMKFEYRIPVIDFHIHPFDYSQLENINIILLANVVFIYDSISKRRWETAYEMEFMPHFRESRGELHVRPNGWTDREMKVGE